MATDGKRRRCGIGRRDREGLLINGVRVWLKFRGNRRATVIIESDAPVSLRRLDRNGIDTGNVGS